MSRIYLCVPFEERDEARRRGARWDPAMKCWFIAASEDPTRFLQWLADETQIAPYSIVSSEASILATWGECWRCSARIEVICVYCERGEIRGQRFHRFTVSNISAVDEVLERQLASWPLFHLGFSRSAGAHYRVNHCTRCGAAQDDYFLHCEPEGAFFAPSLAPAGQFRLHPLSGCIRLNGDEGFEPQ